MSRRGMRHKLNIRLGTQPRRAVGPFKLIVVLLLYWLYSKMALADLEAWYEIHGRWFGTLPKGLLVRNGVRSNAGSADSVLMKGWTELLIAKEAISNWALESCPIEIDPPFQSFYSVCTLDNYIDAKLSRETQIISDIRNCFS
ncbi:hypothetical protein NDU88_007377 [Pleurodeles waltl]|uniref:Uncharacterized protein n=1 Tax=Pleurodeles waltl TaxID=8319 RepID=A0AAV7NTF7_PLEWA|nr:hypothetical protein NDU88_007377 [Pleurodeles waltl]